MRVVDFNCIKCGNLLQAPEESKRVLCSVCGTTNSPGGTLSRLKALVGKTQMPGTGSYSSYKYPEKIEDQTADDFSSGEMEGHPFPEEVQNSSGKRGLGLTAVFVLMPVILMVAEIIDIPPVFILAAAAVIFVVFIAAKRKK